MTQTTTQTNRSLTSYPNIDELGERLLARREARENLIAFTEYTYDRYRTAEHHKIIAGQLERVERGEIDRLMLFVPPRHGKSELASIRFPSWVLGRNPEKQFISVSATAELAGDFGRMVRNTIQDREYGLLFDTKLSEDSKSKGKWHTENGGIYYSVGVGGSLLGRGGDYVLIDDPFATMEQAQSELYRKRLWDWYVGTLYNRLQPGGAIVIIGHRMHEDDLQGMLLEQQAASGDKWEVVELPALNEDETVSLWPEAFTPDDLKRIKSVTIPRFFSALYQQKPTPDEGEYFKEHWFNYYDEVPNSLRVYGASDYAVTNKGGDYTVHIVAGVDTDDNIYILDLYREQSTSDVWVIELLRLINKWKPLNWAEEQGQIIKSLDPIIKKLMNEERVYCAREQFPSVADKPTRARSIQARSSMGRVYLPRSAEWLPEFMHELLTFDAGKHDDIVDAFALIGRMLDKMVSAKKEKKKTGPSDRWAKAFAREEGGGSSWKTA